MEIRDFRGLVIGIGDMIAYPGRSGSNMWMNWGTVERVYPSGELDIKNDTDKQVRILRSDRVAVLGRN